MLAPYKPLHTVKRFYFLEYFYILLRSIEKSSQVEDIFNSFKSLKQQYRLGESRFKKLTEDIENLSKDQLERYRYTFSQVIEEAKDYDLIDEQANKTLFLREKGSRLLHCYADQGSDSFNRVLFSFMESKYNAFKYLIDLLYKANKFRSGLLIFPSYSPRQLGIERTNFRTTLDIESYSEKLVRKLDQDIDNYLRKRIDLTRENGRLLERLFDSGIIPRKGSESFPANKYNVIVKRFRDFWINYFLREIYGYEHSLTSFDIWVYRGEQIGIIHITEIYPGFSGRVVYPTSVITTSAQSQDFKKIYDYPDGQSLFVHEPEGERNVDIFVDSLVRAYYEIRRSNRSYFVSLSAVRELVGYNMKISAQLFEKYLDTVYALQLAADLRIRISLEVDRLPEETNATYLKREPVQVDGRYFNIIGIDVTREKETI